MKADAILIKEKDNVATALRDIQRGEEVRVSIDDSELRVLIQESIPYGHKFAIRDIARGEHVVKYSEVIGKATEGIGLGDHAHIQNIESLRERGDLESEGR
jgi:altronate dehydratase small subunit